MEVNETRYFRVDAQNMLSGVVAARSMRDAFFLAEHFYDDSWHRIVLIDQEKAREATHFETFYEKEVLEKKPLFLGILPVASTSLKLIDHNSYLVH